MIFKNTWFAFIFSLTCAFNVQSQETYPSETIRNDALEVLVYVPNSEIGYYRAARFDWSGVIGSLKYKGHQYFDHWLEKHDPNNFESIKGPVEGFAPIGFENADAGQTFLIIGVGSLEKPDDGKPYHFAVPYKIANHGKWKSKKKKNRIQSTQKLATPNGLAYEYTKIVQLVDNQPKFILEHQLKNTGTLPIETTVYNHNFFVIDQEPTGPNLITRFPYPIKAEGKGFGEMIVAQNSTLTFHQKLNKGENVYTAGIEGFGREAKDYEFNIENKKPVPA
ncbi:MAG: hypothetical protein IPL46_22505 [Saprospiraceae bacterium]|nr:hypothetical protein [Saprospiraceae bacterium]